MLASWLIASRRLASLEVAGDNAAYMWPHILHLLYASDFHLPHVSSTLLPTLHYFTLSLNGSPPLNDDDEQGKNMSPYLIHTG